MPFTKREFEQVAEEAKQLAASGNYDAAMCITQRKVNGLDLSLTTGKYVEELRAVASRYERMYWRKRDEEICS